MALSELNLNSSNRVLTREGFKQVCPMILQQVMSGACKAKESTASTSGSASDADWTKAQSEYLHLIVVILIVSYTTDTSFKINNLYYNCLQTFTKLVN